MHAHVDILNEAHSANDELLIEESSGLIADHSDRVRELVDDETLRELDAGEWVTIVDGEVIGAGQFHPFRVHVTGDDE